MLNKLDPELFQNVDDARQQHAERLKSSRVDLPMDQ